jgi:hypothetical protein
MRRRTEDVIIPDESDEPGVERQKMKGGRHDVHIGHMCCIFGNIAQRRAIFPDPGKMGNSGGYDLRRSCPTRVSEHLGE